MSRRQQIDDLTDLAIPEQPSLSPDGKEIVYVLRTSDAADDRNVLALWRVGSREGDPKRLTAGPADSSPAWSPDCASVAFLRADDGPAQVWLLPASGGEPRRLTDLPLGAGPPVWSPDGSRERRTSHVGPIIVLVTWHMATDPYSWCGNLCDPLLTGQCVTSE